MFFHQAVIAQLGERQTEDLKVPGSIPGRGIFFQKFRFIILELIQHYNSELIKKTRLFSRYFFCKKKKNPHCDFCQARKGLQIFGNQTDKKTDRRSFMLFGGFIADDKRFEKTPTRLLRLRTRRCMSEFHLFHHFNGPSSIS